MYPSHDNMHISMCNMRTCNKQNRQNTDRKQINIKLLRSSMCIDAINQLPKGLNDMDNWKIECEYCNKKIKVQHVQRE